MMHPLAVCCAQMTTTRGVVAWPEPAAHLPPAQVLLTTDKVTVASDHRGRRKRPGLLKRAAAALSRRRNGATGHRSVRTSSMASHPLRPGRKHVFKGVSGG